MFNLAQNSTEYRFILPYINHTSVCFYTAEFWVIKQLFGVFAV